MQAQADGCVDGEEPCVAREAVEHTPHARLLSCHASELSVSRIIEVCPHQQQNANDGVHVVGKVEADTCRYAEDNAEEGDDVRMNAKAAKQACPQQTDGAGEVDVKPFFRVAALKGGLQFVRHDCLYVEK